MTCSRCSAEATIRHDDAYYCGRCAVARDWGDVIAMVQADLRAPAPGGRDPAAVESTGDPFVP